MPDLRAAVSVSGLDDLRNRALKLKKDTGNFELTHLTAELSTVVEYLNLTGQFNMILHSSLLASCTDKELVSFRRKKRIPSVKSLACFYAICHDFDDFRL